MQRTAGAQADSMQRTADAQANKTKGIAAERAIAGHIKDSGRTACAAATPSFPPTNDAAPPLDALTKKDALEVVHALTKEDALEARHAAAALPAEHGTKGPKGSDICFKFFFDVDADLAVATRPVDDALIKKDALKAGQVADQGGPTRGGARRRCARGGARHQGLQVFLRRRCRCCCERSIG